MPNSQTIPFLDPACGSASFFQGAQSVPYNKVSQARLATELRPSGSSNLREAPRFTPLEFLLLMRFWDELALLADHRLEDHWFFIAALLLHDLPVVSSDLSPQPGVSLWSWEKPTRAFDYVLTSIPLEMVTVDTLMVSVPMSCVQVCPSHQLEIVPPPTDQPARTLWRGQDGEQVVGQRAILHQSGLHVEISPFPWGWTGKDSIGCLIHFSVSGVWGHGDNSWPLDRRNAIGVIDMVQERLAELGLTVDLRTAKVVRCDLNRNIALNEAFRHYQPILDALDIPRTDKDNYAQTGTRCSNENQGMLCYDKIAEMKRRGLSTAHLPQHMARLEWQIKRAKNVRKKLGVKTVQDLLDRWETLPAHYVNYKNSLFRYDIEKLQAPRPRCDLRTRTPIQTEIAHLIRWCQTAGINHSLDALQLEAMVRRGELRGYKAKVKALLVENNKRANTSVNRMVTAFWKENFRNPDFVRRYQELKEKFDGVKRPFPSEKPKRAE